MDGEISKLTIEEKLSCQSLTPLTTLNLLDSVDVFLFDCDGVIWKGDALIDGVSDTLDTLRAMDEIFSSSFAAAMYLKANDFPKEKKVCLSVTFFSFSFFSSAGFLVCVYVIGEEGILEELELAGFTGLGVLILKLSPMLINEHFPLQEDGKKTAHLKPNSLFEHDKSVGAVVVGLDQYINFYKLQYGTLCIRENPGCLFIATNRDAVGHLTDLQEWPGAGCMVAAICGSTQKEPIVVGKPSTFLMEFLLQKFNIPTSRMCMVGDRLDTDILFGQNAGCRTLLVLSGVTNLSDLQDSSNHIRPEYYTSTLSDIISLFNNYQSSF
ncbi:hypothetical protein DH2020_017135 [Rehmannia glutinosa]|uniref:Phosphoglycolate phosphatase n=1 Tax=Rehmannia glutinosa TaxID=99300 RepID=A0ABR0WUA1_REHGL